MKKITLLFAAILGAYGVSNAQIRIAPEVGVSFNKITYDPEIGSNSFKIGPRVGGMVDIGLTDNLYLQPGITYVMKGNKNEFAGAKTDITMHYLDVPINLMYKLGKPGGNRFFFGIGPNISYALSGKIKYDDATGFPDEDIKFGSDSTETKALDFGGNVNVGYELSNGLYARAYFNMGFANLSNFDAIKERNMGFGLSIGYFFGL